MIRPRSLLLQILVLGGVLILPTVFVLASAADEFTINLFVGTDTTPPTTPVLLAATPVAATQINIQWSAATDDVLLSGYRVYRDGVAITTTTLTSFSDGGLTASTTYSYTIDAFDNFNNISSSSNAIATSTFALPIVPPATTTPTSTVSSTLSSTRTFGLQSFLLVPNQAGAELTWQTVSMTAYVLKWGRTTSYDSGTISSNLFSQLHKTNITTLEPGTKYYFELTAINPQGITKVIKADSFFTQSALLSVLPVNVEAFTANIRGTDVELSWRNRTLPEGAIVRIIRSHLYYPSSITDGSLIYEGVGEDVTDTKALLVRSPQYYTAFVITKEGLVSSGAIAVAGRVTQPLPATVEENPVIEIGDEGVLRASAVEIIQGRERFTLDATAPLQADADYLISIPVGAVKPGLKSIIVSIQNPSNQREVSRFLLKINQAGDAYEATIPSPLVTGVSRLHVEVFDYQRESVRQITTSIRFVRTENPPVEFPDGLADKQLWLAVAISLLLTIGALALWWLWLLRRRREDNR